MEKKNVDDDLVITEYDSVLSALEKIDGRSNIIASYKVFGDPNNINCSIQISGTSSSTYIRSLSADSYNNYFLDLSEFGGEGDRMDRVNISVPTILNNTIFDKYIGYSTMFSSAIVRHSEGSVSTKLIFRDTFYENGINTTSSDISNILFSTSISLIKSFPHAYLDTDVRLIFIK